MENSFLIWLSSYLDFFWEKTPHEVARMFRRWFILFLVAGLPLLSGCAPDPKMVQKATFHFGLGTSYLQQGDPTSALRELYEAEKLNPKDPQVQHALGMALSAKGKYNDALEHYRKALELDPKYTEVHNTMGATYLEMGRWDEAIQEFNRVLKDILYLTPFFVHNNIGWAYYKKGDLNQAVENYRKAIGMKPDFGLAHYNLGLAYRDRKQADLSIDAFRRA
ncbi:MAG: tetratricopeptide repeat protein, partial [Syntrophaceae bacterium]|nr:tetratricopeptide repeat protein [Syntrophaceae bacterium]